MNMIISFVFNFNNFYKNNNNKMNKQERLKVAFDYLKSKGIIHRQKDIAEKMGSTEPNVSAALKGVEKVLTEKFLTRFNMAFGSVFSEDWLLTGEGDMLKSNVRNMNDVYSASQNDDGVVMVDFVPVSARASFLENLDTSSYNLEKFPIIPKAAEKAEIDKYKIFEVDGDSMYPTISDGALILAKVVPESSWHYAEGVVVAVFSDFVVVKRIARNELLTSNTLVLASDNEKYGQMTVQLADIRAIYKAKRIISSDIR